MNLVVNFLYGSLTKKNLLFALCGCAVFFISVYFSKDWNYYQFTYHSKIENITWISFFLNLSLFKEPLFLIFSKFFGNYFGFSLYIFFITVIAVTVKLGFFGKITLLPYLSAFFYICFYLFLFDGTALRVAYATAFILPMFYFLEQKMFLKAFVLNLIASLIHLTTLSFLIVFPLYFFKSLNRLVFIAFIVSPLFIIFSLDFPIELLKIFAEKINPRYSFYFDSNALIKQNSTGLFFFFVGFFYFLLLTIFYFLRLDIVKDRFLNSTFSLALIAVLLMSFLHNNVAMAARLGELLLLPIVIFLSHLFVYFRKNKLSYHQYVLICISLLFCFARIYYLYIR